MQPLRHMSPLHLALLAGTALVSPFVAHAQNLPARHAAPVLDRVVTGGITIEQGTATTTVTQTQQRGIVDWRSFDVGRDHHVRFQQPSSTAATLNRVTGPDPSVIAGRVSANGQLVIVNQSGVVFARGAQVEAAGLVASAAGITNQNFLNGGSRLNFDQAPRPGARVENAGTITVKEAGLAGLVAPQVANRGTIVARLGRVAMGGAEAAVVDLHGDGLVSLEIVRPVGTAPADGAALVTNTGSIDAQGGTVLLSARAADGIVQNLVRAGGSIAANTDAAGRTGTVALRGTGGAIIIEGDVTATGTAAGTRGGTVTALGDRVLVAFTGRVDASGRAGGGRVGIGAEGRIGTPRVASRAGTAQGAVVRADATQNGPGGTVRIDSTDYTAHAGKVSARGGPQGGDGGMVEISGGQGLRITGTADVSAAAGRQGTVLLDPETLVVVAGGGNVVPGDIVGGVLDAAAGPLNATIDTALIAGIAGDLELQANTSITVNAAISKPNGDLTLTAFSSGAITVNSPIVLGSGDLTLNAGSGDVAVNASLMALGGDISVSGNGIALSANLSASPTGRVVLTGGNDGIVQNTASGITAGALWADVTSGGPLSLGGQNAVGTLERAWTLGNSTPVLIRNQTDLSITGPVGGASNAAVRIEVQGDLDISGNLRGTGPGAGDTLVAVLATGNLNLLGTGVVEAALADTGSIGDVTLVAGWSGSGTAVNPAAAATLTLSGEVSGHTLTNGVTATVTLAAGSGGVIQNGGVIRTQQLAVRSGGDALLDASTPQVNEIGTLLSSEVAGDFRVYSSPVSNYTLTPGQLRLSGTQVAGGTMRLAADPSAGSIVQDAGGVIQAPLLEVSAGSVSLPGANQITALGNSPVPGLLTLRNATALRIAGTVGHASGGGVDILVDAGDLTLEGTVLAGSSVSLHAAAGDVIVTDTGSVVALDDTTLLAGGNVMVDGLVQAPYAELLAGSDIVVGATGQVLTSGASGMLRLAAAYDGSATDPAAAGGIGLAGVVSASGSGTLLMSAGTGGIQQTGGRVEGGYADLGSGGSVLLAHGGATPPSPNALGLIMGNAAGDFVLDNGNTSIVLLSSLVADNIALRTTGMIMASGSAGLSAAGGVISLQAGQVLAETMLGIDAATVEIAPATPVSMTIGGFSSGGFELTLSDLMQISASDVLRLGATSYWSGLLTPSATGIEFVAPLLTGSRLDLRSAGTITQLSGAYLSAPQLNGFAGGAVTLTDPGNAIPQLGNFAAQGGLALVTLGALELAGSILADGQAVALRAGGAITAGPATSDIPVQPPSSTPPAASLGLVAAQTLSLHADGAIALAGANRVQTLTAADTDGSSDIIFHNTAPSLTIPAGTLIETSGGIGITQDGGVLTVDGTVRGGTVTLAGDTQVSVNGFSAIATTGSLFLDAPVVTVNGLIAAAEDIHIAAGSGASLAGQASAPAGTLFIDSPYVTFAGLDAVDTAVHIQLGGTGYATGDIDALSLALAGGRGATLTGSIAGITDGSAAALGERLDSSGVTVPGDPPQNAFDFLFNGCAIASSVCLAPPPPPPPPVWPSLPSPTEIISLVTLLTHNPAATVGVLQPDTLTTAAERLRVPVLPLVVRPPRDRSEEDTLAPADIRVEDY